MKAAVFRGIRDFVVVEMPIPRPGKGEIVVKVAYCGICGSDLHTYKKGVYIQPGSVMGHEFAGIVSEVGDEVQGIRAGDRVVIRPLFDCGACRHCLANRPHLCEKSFQEGIGYGRNGGFAEYVLIPKAQLGKNVFALPSPVSNEEAALVEPLAVAIHAAEMAHLHLSDTVVVFGAGTIGLCLSQVLKAIGNCYVIQVDVSDIRLQVAKKLGVDTVINPKRENVLEKIVAITGRDNFNSGAAADAVFDCAGVPETVKLSLKCVRFGGKVVSVALSEEKTSIDPSIIVQKELVWKGSFAYLNEFPAAIQFIQSGKINVRDLITHVYPVEQIMDAFEKQLDSQSSVKVCIGFC